MVYTSAVSTVAVNPSIQLKSISRLPARSVVHPSRAPRAVTLVQLVFAVVVLAVLRAAGVVQVDRVTAPVAKAYALSAGGPGGPQNCEVAPCRSVSVWYCRQVFQ